MFVLHRHKTSETKIKKTKDEQYGECSNCYWPSLFVRRETMPVKIKIVQSPAERVPVHVEHPAWREFL
jgi:hypothetical protein